MQQNKVTLGRITVPRYPAPVLCNRLRDKRVTSIWVNAFNGINASDAFEIIVVRQAYPHARTVYPTPAWPETAKSGLVPVKIVNDGT